MASGLGCVSHNIVLHVCWLKHGAWLFYIEREYSSFFSHDIEFKVKFHDEIYFESQNSHKLQLKSVQKNSQRKITIILFL